jgi:hypothetical protein
MRAPVHSPAGSRSPAGLTTLVMALCLGLVVTPQARARPPAASPEIAGLRLSPELREFELRLGAHDLTLRLGALPAEGLHLGRFDLGGPPVGISVGFRYIDLALAVGTQLARDGSAAMSLAAQLRLGARDAMNVTARYGYLLAPEAAPGRRLLPQGAISVPLGPRLAVTGEGSLLGDGGALGTIGLSYQLESGGAPLFLSGGVGFTFRRADPDCRGGGQLRVNADWCAVPAAIFGIEGRF